MTDKMPKTLNHYEFSLTTTVQFQCPPKPSALNSQTFTLSVSV